MKTALIMEGGAMRGMFTCGVIDVFMENGITFDGAAGISAGAGFGCNIKSRQIGRPIRYNKKYCRDPRYCSIRSLLKTGDLFGADFCYRELPEILDPFDSKTFAENPMAFYAGATASMPERQTLKPANANTICSRTERARICSGSGPRPPCPWFQGRSPSAVMNTWTVASATPSHMPSWSNRGMTETSSS